MIITLIEVFRKYLYNVGIWIECTASMKAPRSVPVVQKSKQSSLTEKSQLFIYARPLKIVAHSHIKYTIVPSAWVLGILGHVWGHFWGVQGKQRWHDGEGEHKMIDMFWRVFDMSDIADLQTQIMMGYGAKALKRWQLLGPVP